MDHNETVFMKHALKRTASYLIALVNARCGVRIDPRWFAAQVSVPA
jgi:hypothetical protein